MAAIRRCFQAPLLSKYCDKVTESQRHLNYGNNVRKSMDCNHIIAGNLKVILLMIFRKKHNQP